MNTFPAARPLRRAFVLLGVFASASLFAGCASAGGGTAGGGGGGGLFAQITADEVAASGATDGLQVLQRIRPNWLTAMGGEILLYVDNQRMAESVGIENFLRTQPAGAMVGAEWLREEAAMRLPRAPLTGDVAGAIMLTTRGGGE